MERSPDTLALQAGTVDLRLGLLHAADGDRKLTTKEVALLRYLASREGVDVPREDVLRDVWGYSGRAVSRAVDTALQRLRAKVELDTRQPRHLLTVTGLGYRFEGLPATPPPPPGPSGAASPPAALPDGGLRPASDDRPTAAAPVPGDLPESQSPPRDLPRSQPPPRRLAPLDRFVGRREELSRVEALLHERPLVTLLGPAGIGKTRLARQVADALAPSFGGGALMVELSGARTADEVRRQVARALGNPLGSLAPGQDPDDRLGAALSTRGPLLLLLDNLEQVVDEAAPLVDRWLRQAEQLRVLATSREALRLGVEGVIALPALPTDDGVELFCERARTVRPGWRPDPAGDDALRALVERLDGLPLAIELAASRAGLLDPAAILRRLDDRFGLLVARRRDLEPRQRTLRGALDWSWDLLDADEREVLAGCAAFRGGFEFAVAEQVLVPPNSPVDVLDVLDALREKSLVRATDPLVSREPPRLSLLHSVLAYAEERLAERPDRDALLARHAAWYLRHGERLCDEIDGPDPWGALPRLRREVANLEAVRSRALPSRPREAARATLALHRAISGAGPATRSLDLLDELPTGDLPPELVARLQLARARALLDAGRLADSEEAGRRASAAAEQADDEALRVRAILAVADAARVQGQLEDIERSFGEAVARAERIGERGLACAARVSLSLALFLRRELPAAEEQARLALEAAVAGGHARLRVEATRMVGRCLARRGEFDASDRALREALEQAERLGDLRTTALVLQNISMMHEEAPPRIRARLPDAGLRSLAVARELGDPRLVAQALRDLATEALVDGRLAEASDALVEVRGLARATADRVLQGRVLSDMGVVLLLQGRLEQGEEVLREALGVAEEAEDRFYVAVCLGNLAISAHLRGDLPAARALFERVLAHGDWLASARLERYVRLFALLVEIEAGGDGATDDLARLREEVEDDIGRALLAVAESSGQRARARALARSEAAAAAALLGAADERLAELGTAGRSADVQLALRVASRLEPGGA